MPIATPVLTPHGRYLRQIPGSGFSLQANTEQTPTADHFYVFLAGEVVLETEDFEAAEGEYKRLSRQFWEDRLRSTDPHERLTSAWGLLGQDPDNRAAGQVVQNDGNDGERKRLKQIRMRRAAPRRAEAGGRRYRSSF
jgi:hypothetical protein